MLIFDRAPTDWSDLQNMVGQMFSELGCEVEVGRTVDLVRGRKAIDVWARDTATHPPSIILVECKHWERPLPQEVVHSFRTVVADAGAHRGFIVSRCGFQSGAFEAAGSSNLDLVTFETLQEMLFPRWKRAMGERLRPFGDRLFPYWDPTGGRRPQVPWTGSHREHHRQLMKAYAPLMQLGPAFQHTDYTWTLPLELTTIDGGRLRLETYRQVYDFIDANKDAALEAFRRNHGELP